MRNAEKQPEAVRFVTGIDQSNGTRGGQPGTFDLVKNMRFQSGGLQKRCGTAAVTGATTATDAGFALADTAGTGRPTEKAAFVGRIGQQKLAATSAGHVFAYGGTTMAYRAAISAAQPVRKRLGLPPTLATKPVGPFAPAVAATSAGYVCTASGFGNQLKVTVESPNGDLLMDTSTTVGAASVIVRIAVVGSEFFVCYQGSADTTVTVWRISIASGELSNNFQGSLVTLANASSCWDLSNYDGTNWFLIYQSGATTVTLAKMAAATASATATFSSTDNLTYLSVWADPATARVWVGVVDDPTSAATGQFRVYTATPTLSVGPTSIAGTPTGAILFGPLYKRTPVAGDAFGVFMDTATGPGRVSLTAVVVEAGSLTREVTQCHNVIPISKPDAQQRVWCMTYADSANFTIAKALLLRFSGADYVGDSSVDSTPVVDLASPDFETPGATFHPFAQSGRAFNAVAVTTESAGGAAFFALPFVLTSRTNAAGGTEPTARVDVYEYTRWNQAPHQPMLANGRAAYVAGQPTELYGEPFRIEASSIVRPTGGVELGFAHGPTVLAVTTTPDGNGLAAGSYVYYFLQQFVDDEGNRHLSAVSAPYTVVLTVPSSVQIDVTNCYVGQRPAIDRDISTRSPATLAYRTQSGGTEAQLVPITVGETGANWTGYARATDTVADSIVDDNEFIYTAGGVLPNVLAPSCRYIAVSEERLWCGGLWDSNIIECSKVRVPGEPFNFTGHPSHQVVIPGEVSGLAYMDGQVVAFTEDAIYLVSGDGPNDQGAGGFAPPRALVRGVGCPHEQSASILETEAGILFRSAMGFYAIPRGFGTPQYIGEKVQDENPIVLSAATTTTSDNRLARFLVAEAGGTKSNKVLTLDITNMQWIRDEYTVDGEEITGQGFSEIGEWPDGLALMSYGLDRADNPNVIWAEDEDLTGDAGAAGVSATTYISQYARTNWASIAGPTGLMRCSEVVVKMEPIGSSSAVTMAVETDRNASQELTWTITNSSPVEYRSLVVKEQQCTEFRVTVSDAAGAANSAGVRLLALGVEVGPIPGIRRGTDSEGG